MTHRQTQYERILHLLLEADGAEVPLPKILALGIAQYNARIKEIRQAGHNVVNRTERVNGVRHSWYRLERP